jgi:poly-gamma-glutamate synthesis protein (capsule biosynthesis protein)
MNTRNNVLFLGDVVPYKKFRFRNSTKTVINLECPITMAGKPISGKINLNVKENHLRSIFGSDLLAVCLANNHILDYGLEGLDSTLRELESEGIKYFGLNKPMDGYLNPLIITHGGRKIAMMAFICESTSPLIEFDDFNYLSLLEMNEITCRIDKVRKEVDRIVIYVHWGEEESSLPAVNDIIKARKMIDAGADIVIGSHAHSPQPVEKYHNGIIAYNMGNFIMPAFNETPSYFTEEGVPLSSFTKRLMLWNRFSWGLEVDMVSLEFRIRKFAFIANRIIEFTTTPYDDYLALHPETFSERYESVIKKHLERRSRHRKIRDFIQKPHIPQRLLKKVF